MDNLTNSEQSYAYGDMIVTMSAVNDLRTSTLNRMINYYLITKKSFFGKTKYYGTSPDGWHRDKAHASVFITSEEAKDEIDKLSYLTRKRCTIVLVEANLY